MSSSEPSFANFLQLNKETLLLYSVSLLSPCKCSNSCNDLVVGSVKIKWEKKERLQDLEEIIHGCGSEEDSHGGL